MDEREVFELIAEVRQEDEEASKLELRLALMERLKGLSTLADNGLLVLGELWLTTIERS